MYGYGSIDMDMDMLYNLEGKEGRFPNWTTISADGGPVGKTPSCPFHIATVFIMKCQIGTIICIGCI